MKRVDWKDVAIRAAKTFMQTAAAAFVAGLEGVDMFAAEYSFWGALALSAGAAGVCAVWNGLIEPVIGPMLAKAD